jgi:hypothetical protein
MRKTEDKLSLEREKAASLAGLESLRESIGLTEKALVCDSGRPRGECEFKEVMKPSIKTNQGYIQSYLHKGMRHYVAKCKTCGIEQFKADKAITPAT